MTRAEAVDAGVKAAQAMVRAVNDARAIARAQGANSFAHLVALEKAKEKATEYDRCMATARECR